MAHVNFYLEVIERYVLTRESQDVDWNAIWRTVEQVSPDEWAGLLRRLRQSYERNNKMLRELETWDDEDVISGALAIVVHTAYHLGEIRQVLCTLK